MSRALVLLTMLAVAACTSPMAKIEALRDSLVEDNWADILPRVSAYPPSKDSQAKAGSPEAAAFLTEIANALGSKKGFVNSPPDHAGAATAGVVVLRGGRTDWLGDVDVWLGDLKSAKGIGHDVLRLATASAMATAAPFVGRKIENEAVARATLVTIFHAIPGACTTYLLVGTRDPKAIPPELDADHSPCVQKDLSRREGPGGTYGAGVFRAMEGALALWRETERALRLGAALADPGPKATLEKKLAVIEATTKLIETKKLVPDANDAASMAVMAAMREAHAEAGVPFVKDAGSDAAPAPAPPRPPSR